AELAHSDQKRCLDPEDRSIAVQVCHSAQREVEVLQDHLLALPDSRFVSEDVLALLDVPALASHFAIDESGLRLLRR
ncbi:exodeoxyribonuclease V subunit gamma, partial [Pantoea agglomerans]|uniref:exodeoxyribonuclease V subunit gamma n=1 Tax=Enterobacter agglomerans TaxID=549 RepID=UPI001A8CDFB3